MSTPLDTPPRVRIESPETSIRETIPNYYTTNTFEFDDPDVGLKWLANITETDRVHKLRKLYCHVSRLYNPGPNPDPFFLTPPNGPKWVEFINALVTLASSSGLEEVTFYLDSEPTCNHWGAAVDLTFLRALGGMLGLCKLELDGFFPKEWPKYLKQKTGLEVWEKTGKNPVYLQNLKEFQDLFKDQVFEGI